MTKMKKAVDFGIKMALIASLSTPATGFGNARAPLYNDAPVPVVFTQ